MARAVAGHRRLQLKRRDCAGADAAASHVRAAGYAGQGAGGAAGRKPFAGGAAARPGNSGARYSCGLPGLRGDADGHPGPIADA